MLFKLDFFPEGLQNISTLQELYLDSMPPDLARRLKGEENYKIKHIPKLKFCSAFWSIVFRRLSRLSLIILWLYSKKFSESAVLKCWQPSLSTPRILAARSWDSLDTPMELICMYSVIFLATSLSLTSAQLQFGNKRISRKEQDELPST